MPSSSGHFSSQFPTQVSFCYISLAVLPDLKGNFDSHTLGWVALRRGLGVAERKHGSQSHGSVLEIHD